MPLVLDKVAWLVVCLCNIQSEGDVVAAII